MGSLGDFLRLMRWHVPVPMLLLLGPGLFILALMSPIDMYGFLLLLKIVTGTFIARSLGSAINDIIDLELDAKVERCKSRPLASGRLTLHEALILCGLLAVCGFAIVLTMRKEVLIVAIALFVAMIIYPFTKRFLPLPQAFLGILFPSSALLCALEIEGLVDISSMLIYIGCVTWVIGYDTIYAFQDVEDDKKLRLKSAAIFFKHPKRAVGLLYDITGMVWIITGMLYHMGDIFIILAVASWLCLRWQVSNFNPDSDDKKSFYKLFNSNIIIVLLMTAAFFSGRSNGITAVNEGFNSLIHNLWST